MEHEREQLHAQINELTKLVTALQQTVSDQEIELIVLRSKDEKRRAKNRERMTKKRKPQLNERNTSERRFDELAETLHKCEM